MFNKRARSVLPQTMKDLQQFTNSIQTDENGYATGRQVSMDLAKRGIIKHNVTWIEENGICMEKIRPGPSTIQGAGRGALAQMFIAKGDLIAPSPLLTIPNKNAMLMYNTTVNDHGELIKDSDIPIGQQLLLNYCFGHMNSTLLLCPSSNVILINHCSERSYGKIACNNGNGANAKIQWAQSGWDPRTDDWLQMSLEEIKSLTGEGKRGLSFEVIATRDIQIGEEVSH